MNGEVCDDLYWTVSDKNIASISATSSVGVQSNLNSIARAAVTTSDIVGTWNGSYTLMPGMTGFMECVFNSDGTGSMTYSGDLGLDGTVNFTWSNDGPEIKITTTSTTGDTGDFKPNEDYTMAYLSASMTATGKDTIKSGLYDLIKEGGSGGGSGSGNGGNSGGNFAEGAVCVVSGISAGKVKITAQTKDYKYSATCTVTVTEKGVAATGLTLDKTSVELEYGEKIMLRPTFTPANATDQSVTWTSSDTSVATVNEYGVVTAVATHTANGTITVKSPTYGYTATCEVTVKVNPKPLTKDNADEILGAGWRDRSHITIPVGVTEIDRYTFAGCKNLTSVIIPEGVTEIGESAFSNCTGLKSVTIPGSIEKMEYAFGGCYNLSEVRYTGTLAQWCSCPIPVPYSCKIYIDGAELKGNIVIPEGATSIGYSAFYNMDKITSVIIPDSVTSIGGSAFSNCTGLKSVTIPDSVTSIGGSAFYNCTGLTSVTIPDSVNSIGGQAFSFCTGLKSVTIPSGVTEIGSYTFSNCTGLKSVTIPSGVTSIGNYAFYYCTGLTSVIIPEGVTEIGESAFYYCTELTSVTIPDSVTSIGGSAFSNCTGLTNVTIPSGVTSIESHTFYNCDNINEVHYTGTLAQWCAISFENGSNPMRGGSKLYIDGAELKGDLVIPDGISSIGDSAFSFCTGLTSVIIPEGVTEIGESAFYYCTELTSVTIPDSVTSIGGSAFSNCTGLTNVTIPESVTSIGYYAFSGCDNINEVHYTGTLAQWCAISFENGSNPMRGGSKLYIDGAELKGDLVIPDGISSIGDSAFSFCTGLTSVIIPEGVTEIGESAFYYCTELTSVTIPESVTSIGYYAFSGCNNINEVHYTGTLAQWCGISFASNNSNPMRGGSKLYIDGAELKGDIVIPDGISSIGDSAFYYCTVLTSVTIPSGVAEIGSCTFSNCTGLTSVTIPSSVTSIGGLAFYGCTGLTSVTIEALTPPSLGSGTFDSNAYGRKIYVPATVVNTYKSATGWSSYASAIVAIQN